MYKATLSFTTKNYDVRKNQILAEDFTTQSEIDEYLSIGYIVEYDGTLEITQNGLYDVEDYEQANVDVPSGEPTLQSKSVTITTNTTTNIQADTGYDGLSSVAVTTNINTGGYNTKANTNIFRIPGTVINMSKVYELIEELPDTLTIGLSGSTTVLQSFFEGMGSLKSLPNIDTTGQTNFYHLANSCRNLENVPVYNTASINNVNGFNGMFTNCGKLTNDSLNNIMQMCINAVNFTGTKTLKHVGLTSAQATTCQSLSNWSALSALGWTTGY